MPLFPFATDFNLNWFSNGIDPLVRTNPSAILFSYDPYEIYDCVSFQSLIAESILSGSIGNFTPFIWLSYPNNDQRELTDLEIPRLFCDANLGLLPYDNGSGTILRNITLVSPWKSFLFQRCTNIKYPWCESYVQKFYNLSVAWRNHYQQIIDPIQRIKLNPFTFGDDGIAFDVSNIAFSNQFCVITYFVLGENNSFDRHYFIIDTTIKPIWYFKPFARVLIYSLVVSGDANLAQFIYDRLHSLEPNLLFNNFPDLILPYFPSNSFNFIPEEYQGVEIVLTPASNDYWNNQTLISVQTTNESGFFRYQLLAGGTNKVYKETFLVTGNSLWKVQADNLVINDPTNVQAITLAELNEITRKTKYWGAITAHPTIPETNQ